MTSFPEPQQQGSSFGFTAWRGLSRAMAVSHAHNDIEINYSLSPLTYDSVGTISVLPAGVPFAFWGAKHHQLVQIETDEPLAFVTVPLATFLSFGLPETMKTGLLNGNILRAPTDEYDWLVPSFERWARDLQRGDGLGSRAAVLEVEGLLARIAAGTWAETQSDPHRTSLDLQRAASMASYISTHFTCDLRVSDVAEQVHLHPNRAATVFRRVFGTSIPAYLQNFRIAEAQRLLLTTDLDSAQVATRAGFQSSSSYHHAFAAMSGASPHRWRRQHLGGS